MSALRIFVFLWLATGAWAATLRLEFQPQPLVRDGATLSRLDWLVSELALQRADGSWVQGGDWFGFLGATAGRLRVEADGVSAEAFRAVRFRVGLPEVVDLSDPAQWPAGHSLHPDVNKLHWGWRNGYVHLAIEGQQQGGEGYSYHLARQADAMIVTLPVEFRGDGPVTIRIALDPTRILEGVDFQRDGNSTHSREGDPLAVRMKASVVAAFRVLGVSHDMYQAPAADAKAALLPPGTKAYALPVTQRFPQVRLPADNLLTHEGVALGRRLFHETRMSINNSQSCASCHQRPAGFSDPRRFSLGAEGQRGKRQAMSLFNLAWHGALFWDGRAPTLRAQALVPIEDPLEMHESLPGVVAKLAADKTYPGEFAKAFGSDGVTAERIGLAIEQFLLTLISQDSRFDRAARGRETLTEEEKRGLQLFITEHDPARGLRGADCFHCHGGTLFTDHDFKNNGLALADDDLGRMLVTGRETDRAKFKTPSLRNVAATAPYMHDGRFATLEEVVEHYDRGVQRSPTLDPNLAKHPMSGLGLSAAEKRDLVAFLKTLTDDTFLKPPPPDGELAAKK